MLWHLTQRCGLIMWAMREVFPKALPVIVHREARVGQAGLGFDYLGDLLKSLACQITRERDLNQAV